MTHGSRRTRIISLLCAACTGACLFLYGNGNISLHRLELWAKDFFLRNERFELGPDPRLVFLGIDQPSYADIIAPEEAAGDIVLSQLTNSFPWSRVVWASAVERLVNAGARVVMLDLVFSAPGVGDDALHSALARHQGRVVIGANFLGGNKSVGGTESVLLPAETVLSVSNDAPSWRDPRVGFVNFFTDIDDVARRATFEVAGEYGLPPDGVMRSLTARALAACDLSHLIPPGRDSHLFRFSAPPGLGYKPIPFYQIFLSQYWKNNFGEGAFFKDKIVIIGPAANIFHDEHRTPYPGGAMLGPEIHLNVLGAALRGGFLRETSYPADLVLILMSGGLALLLALVVRSPIRRLLMAAIATGGYFAITVLVFSKADLFLLAVIPVIALNTSTLTAFTYDFILLRMEKNRTRRTLERYVSKDVVRELLDNPQTYLNTLQGVRKPVTILFSDVRGFTTMTEAADPAQLVTQLNEYFKEMVGIVFVEHGSLDKFIGDAVMALWGSITSEGAGRDAQRAVAAALAMRRALARLNINWQQRGMKSLEFGIGVNQGDVIVGNLGSEEKMEVSVIGDPVNLASRLEGLTKEYKLDLLLGESMVPLVQDRFALRTVDSVQVKGKTKPVRVFTVIADLTAGERPPPWLARYEEGISFYRSRQFAKGVTAFAECLREHPEDYLSSLYLKRCEDLVANPPGPDWDTVFVMHSK